MPAHKRKAFWSDGALSHEYRGVSLCEGDAGAEKYHRAEYSPALSGAPLDLKPTNGQLRDVSRSQGTKMRQSAKLVIATALVLAFGAAPAMAEKVFGAIAFSASTGKFGWVKNTANKEDAQSEAVTQCGVDDCDTVVTFPQCAALSVGDGFGMGFSADKSAARAEETALTQCDGFTTNCIISTSFCNDK